MATEYHIYTNSGSGDPINYAAPAAAVTGLTWTSSTLSDPGTWSFGVRAFDTVSGLEEANLDCAVTIKLDASGNDITQQPPPPLALRALVMAGGAIRLEWFYPPVTGPMAPSGFHVYIGTGGTPNYMTPATTISYLSGLTNTFVANLAGLTDSATYTIGVRAYNATAEETNTYTVTAMADSTGPGAVDQLTGIATS